METVGVMNSIRKGGVRKTDGMHNIEIHLEAGNRMHIEHTGCYLV